ncbi:MAG: sugar phosphate isomerase/epimerase [Planctomycetota bacterium]|jgi:D-psicose/D-tagatose/L-ribulose 3-epimerase|nr:sugar phosphate isomerase/epimerase [Planctomycetota bacterium]
MSFKFGVDSFIWAENFTEKDLWIIKKAKDLGFDYLDLAIAHPETFPTEKVKAELDKVGIIPITTTTLGRDTNTISPDPAVRRKGVESLKLLVDINYRLGSSVLGGVNYAGWGCLSGKPATDEEWKWSTDCMREAAQYAASKGSLVIAVEAVNRFETHLINTAEQGVRYCKMVGTPNLKVHLDCFHMNIEETDFAEAVAACGKEYLGYVHVNESNRGIPGTGLVRWKEFFTALKRVGYFKPLTIESFDPNFEELSKNCAIWRRFTETGEELAVKGLANLSRIAGQVA